MDGFDILKTDTTSRAAKQFAQFRMHEKVAVHWIPEQQRRRAASKKLSTPRTKPTAAEASANENGAVDTLEKSVSADTTATDAYDISRALSIVIYHDNDLPDDSM